MKSSTERGFLSLTPQCHSLIQPGGCRAQPMNSGLSFRMLENLFSYTQDIFQCIASIIQILSLWRFPPVVKSEHVVIILHIIFVEQHIDLRKSNLKSMSTFYTSTSNGFTKTSWGTMLSVHGPGYVEALVTSLSTKGSSSRRVSHLKPSGRL